MFCLHVARSSTNRPSLSAHCSSPHISLARAPPSLPRLSSIWQCPLIFEPRRPSFNRWRKSVASAIDIVHHHVNTCRRYDLSMFRRRRPADVRCQRSIVGANRSNASNLFTPRRRVGVAMPVLPAHATGTCAGASARRHTCESTCKHSLAQHQV